MKKIINIKNHRIEIFYIPIEEYAQKVEEAVLTNQFGIYISTGEGIHAYHGNQPIDRDLCEELGVRVVDLNYNGGTILGSAEDLSIIMVFPKTLGMTHELIINKIAEIINKYVPLVLVDGNDILIGGNKICGSMNRTVCGSYEWAAQISFKDYSEYIEKICNKPQVKKPSYIDSNLLSRDLLEEEIINWLNTIK
jgi:lipoate-protein ligase A